MVESDVEILDELIEEITAPAERGAKIGRNDPCLCGSGQKYKRCCLGKA